jgi:hypothetical protein
METPGLLYEVVLHYPNEITREPHIHYFTRDYAAAQAFYYTGETLCPGANINVHWAIDEASVPLCRPCYNARYDELDAELYRSRPLPPVPASDV